MAVARKINKDYNKEEIFQTLDNLELSRKDNTIQTHFQGRLIANTLVTNKYELFDFPTFAKDVVEQVENYFTPEQFQLRITKGQQELRLIGEEVLINGDKYSKMFNILNSTDKSRALQLNVGLIRFICSNGMVVAIDEEYAGLKTKHFKNSLPEKVKLFVDNLDTFDMNISRQSETLDALGGSFVSFKELADKLTVDDKGIVSPNKVLKLRAFANKILTSETDKLVGLNAEQITLLNNANFYTDSKFNLVDIEMSAYTALNCWTEVYRNYDSSVLKRETSRILELV